MTRRGRLRKAPGRTDANTAGDPGCTGNVVLKRTGLQCANARPQALNCLCAAVAALADWRTDGLTDWASAAHDGLTGWRLGLLPSGMRWMAMSPTATFPRITTLPLRTASHAL